MARNVSGNDCIVVGFTYTYIIKFNQLLTAGQWFPEKIIDCHEITEILTVDKDLIHQESYTIKYAVS